MDGKPIIFIIYLVVVSGAELVMTYHSVTLGLWIFSILLLSLIALSTLSIRSGPPPEDGLSEKKLRSKLIRFRKQTFTVTVIPGFRPPEDVRDLSIHAEYGFSNFLKCLTLAPLIRMLSTSMPVAPLEQIYWFVLINTPLFIVTFLLIRSQMLTRKFLGLRLGDWRIQLPIAVTGFFLGFMDYSFLEPAPLIASLTPEAFIMPAAILMVFTGFSEELIFRGLIQSHAERLTGRFYGLAFTSLLFAAMHIGWESFPDLLFVLGVGLFYGYAFQKTRCLTGIALSHGITNITMFLLVPFLW
jgi:membrane protease YdiL (CAAX protease family)